MQRLFIYGPSAYRSEIALYRAERVTAAECETVEVPADTAMLFRIASEKHREAITHDPAIAQAALTGGQLKLLQVIAVSR